MEPANQSFFSNPKEYSRLMLIAAGHSNSGVRGGMTSITEDKIRAGERIYRVGHSNLPMTINMSSPWWMREETFLYIMGVAERAGSDPNELYRMKCAVSYDFGVSDIVLKAHVKQTLRVFTGRGRPVEDDSEGRRGQWWHGGYEIAQLFIPGLRDFEKKMPTKLCHDAIEIEEKFKVSDYNRVQRGRLKKINKTLFREFDAGKGQGLI